MRFLGIGETAGLGDMYLRLAAKGHEVRVFVGEAGCRDTLQGLLQQTADWRGELAWIRAAGREGILIFEDAQMGALQDELRREGFNVIGGSAFGDRLENERAFGQECMREAGFATAATHTFADFGAAIDFVERNPRRYVFKLNGGFASGRNHVGELDDGRDVMALLAHRAATWSFEEVPSFILMDHIDGVEVGVGGYFNAAGIWPLEFTCRFGYPGFAICEALHAEGWDDLFARMIARDRLDFRTHPGFAVGVQLTVPPFPRTDRYTELSKGLPVLFRTPPTEADQRHMHLGEVDIRDGQMLASGESGLLMTVTGTGETVEAARQEVYALAHKVVVPNLRYRTDIGLRFLHRDRDLLQAARLWPGL